MKNLLFFILFLFTAYALKKHASANPASTIEAKLLSAYINTYQRTGWHLQTSPAYNTIVFLNVDLNTPTRSVKNQLACISALQMIGTRSKRFGNVPKFIS